MTAEQRQRRSRGEPHGTDDAQRFLTAWKQIETLLRERWHRAHRGQVAPDADQILRWAERRRLITSEVEDFLQSCRRARNAYAHIAFDGYHGPVALPPRPVVQRLERVLARLRSPARAGNVGVKAITCDARTPLAEALQTMEKHDLSQLPYHHPRHGWVLVTREQVARWVASLTDETGRASADLRRPVRDVADDPRIGPVIPRRVTPRQPVSALVRELEAALSTPDNTPGGYPTVVVVTDDRSSGTPLLVTPDDLSRLQTLLGR